MKKLYTVIGDVEETVVHHYRQYGIRISFISALEFLIGAKKTHTRIPAVPAFFDLMGDSEFAKYISRMPVDIVQILEDAHKSPVIVEENTIPENKDVFVFKHIPYIYDALHKHNYFEINFMYSKSCVQYFENERRELSEGDMCIIPPYAPHNIIAEPGALVLAILVRKSTFDRIFWGLLTKKDLLSAFFRHSLYEKENTPNYLFMRTDNRAGIKYLIQNIAAESNLTDAYANSCAVSLLNALFGIVLRTYGNTIELYNEKTSIRSSSDFPLLLQHIQHNYRTITLSELASRFHYSEAYLSKLIKNNMGRGFVELLQDIRMNRAADSLRSTDMRVREISELVGYDSVDHFSRTFKKTFGVPPLDYRKQSAAPSINT